MLGKLKGLGAVALGVLGFVAMIAVPIVVLRGSLWASTHLLNPLITAGWIAVALDVLLLLPLSIFKKLRGFTGTGIMFSSFLFGAVTWLLGLVVTYSLWGGFAVIVGVLFMGVGVVPIGMAASAWNGMWEPFFTLSVLTVVTFGSRFLGGFIAATGET